MSEQQKIAAAKRGEERTAELKEKVAIAIREIEIEMQANDNIYPHNGGALNIAEIVRRAKINESSLYKKDAQNIALKKSVCDWLENLNKEEVINRTGVKKTLTEQIKEWQKKYEALEQRHLRTELELQACQAEKEQVEKEINQKVLCLQRENSALQTALGRPNPTSIIPFPN